VRLFFLTAIALVSGCATIPSDVVPIGKDTYQLSMTGVGFATQANTSMKALKAANAYCGNLGKNLVLRHSAESGVYGFSPRQDQLVFQCLSADDPAYSRISVQKDADAVVEQR
jgi:hypothetical protein